MANSRSTTRREFLQGKSAVDALHDLTSGAGESAEALDREQSTGGYHLRYSRRAMACNFELLLNAGEYPAQADAAMDVLDLVDRLEDQLTVYRDTSEVSRINQTAATEPVRVEARLFALLEQAALLYQETGGAFDITAGPLAKVWGFYRRAGRLPEPEELHAALARVGSRYLELDAQQRTVRFSLPGIEINLGAIGKGYALDRCAQELATRGVDNFLLHGGQSSVLARGSSSGAGESGGWIVGLRNPLRPEQRLAEIRLKDRALGTSGSGTQFFLHRGKRYGHIIDPRTGQPAKGVLTATALAPTAAEADALATAFYVMGPEAATQYCETHAGTAAVIVSPSDKAGVVNIISACLDNDELIIV